MRLPDPASSRALLIGSGSFDDERLNDLPAVHNNLDALAANLTSEQGASLRTGYCVRLTDPAEIQVVGAHLEEVARETEDTLLVYYAGHGLVDDSGELYLTLPNTTRELLRWNGLPFSRVRHVLAHARARNRVLILDCCFSGKATEAMSDPDGLVSGQIEVDGTYTLASAPANRHSNAPEGATYTAFTGELLTVLRSGLPEEPELLTLGAVYRSLRNTLISRGLYPPQQRGTQTADLLALAPNAAHVPPMPRHPGTELVAEALAAEPAESPVDWYARAAESGDTTAMNQLGTLLENRGEHGEAQSWYRRAAHAGELEAMVRLGRSLCEAGEREQAETWYRQAADQGHAEAMRRLGVLLWRREHEDAEFWLQRSAGAGDSRAMLHLGVLDEQRNAIPSAKGWYGLAAQAGEFEAMLGLGVFAGASGDIGRARYWLRKAANNDQPHGSASSELDSVIAQLVGLKERESDTERARFQRLGILRRFAVTDWKSRIARALVRRDEEAVDAGDVGAHIDLGAAAEQRDNPIEAERHYLAAAAKHSSAGAFRLAMLLDQQGRIDEAKPWYTTAAEADIAPARCRLGVFAEQEGRTAEAHGWYRKAADGDDADAMVKLGRLLEDSDVGAAEEWYLRAARRGDAEAMFRVGTLVNARGDMAAIRWFKKAADLEHVDAMFRLGEVLLERNEPGEARKWFRNARDAGHPDAPRALHEVPRLRRRSLGSRE